ncbi:MAG: formyltransferase family protein [Fibrobacterota bacterium]
MIFVWCTYRRWSFDILEAVLGGSELRPAAIVTTVDCNCDMTPFIAEGIEVLRVNPREARREFSAAGSVYQRLRELQVDLVISPGWSWIIPNDMLRLCTCVTYHPGKLPADRGGSPIQNQIRQGSSWTWLNVMKQESGLDEGPVYLRRRISLSGTADDVWRRMTAAGSLLTLEFIPAIARGFVPKPQADISPVIHKRVTPEDARIKTEVHTAQEVCRIVRAHTECDPDSYVVRPWVSLKGALRCEIARAQRECPRQRRLISLTDLPRKGQELFRLFEELNAERTALTLSCADGEHAYITAGILRMKGGTL